MHKICHGLILLSIFIQLIGKSYAANHFGTNIGIITDMKHLAKEESTYLIDNNKSERMVENFENPFIINDSFVNRAKLFPNNLKFMYNKYKSTYLGNRTSADYKGLVNKLKRSRKKDVNSLNKTTTLSASIDNTNIKSMAKDLKKKKHNYKTWYELGPLLNLTMDLKKNLVKMKLNANYLKELFGKRDLLNDHLSRGRGKKHEMIMRIIPLLAIPFLIQSSIMPFLMSTLKLLLVKAMMVGKIAIFLVLLTAFRNQKNMQAFEMTQPTYWAGEPHKRRYHVDPNATNLPYSTDYRIVNTP